MKLFKKKYYEELLGLEEESRDPVFFTGGSWYFWTETWSETRGPFNSEAEARKALERYSGNL